MLLQKAKPSCNAKPKHITCETYEMIHLLGSKYSLSWGIVQILGATVERWESTGQFDLSAVGMIEVKTKSKAMIS